MTSMKTHTLHSTLLFVVFNFISLLAQSEVIKDVTCFRAVDPTRIEASMLDENGDVVVTENASSATLKLFVATYENEGLPAMNKSHLSVTTESGVMIQVHALQFEQGTVASRRYQVECDGGSMTVDQVNVAPGEASRVLVTSSYIRGDVDGCEGVASVKSSLGTQFTQVACDSKF